jgi:hypothetical protein
LDELQDVERVENPLSENGTQTLYLFRCDGLLAEGQRLAVDDQHGLVGVYQEHRLVTKTSMNAREISALTLLVLALPLPVHHYMIQNLYTLYAMNEEHRESPSNEHRVNSGHDLVIACNEKLGSLGMAIVPISTEYQLTAGSETH